MNWLKHYVLQLGDPNPNLIQTSKKQAHHFRRYVWYSQPGPSDVQGDGPDAHYHFHGRMDLQDVAARLPVNDAHAMYFFCGPPTWMQSVAQQLQGFGVPKENLSFEAFGPATDVVE